VSSSGAICGKDIVWAINDLVFLFFITTPPIKVKHAIINLRDHDHNKDERIFHRRLPRPAPCVVRGWTPANAKEYQAMLLTAPKHHRKIRHSVAAIEGLRKQRT
ncbi:hypothetical protein ACLOJK_028219, partial [Asimina triloba]